jgi:hypothetical protein
MGRGDELTGSHLAAVLGRGPYHIPEQADVIAAASESDIKTSRTTLPRSIALLSPATFALA